MSMITPAETIIHNGRIATLDWGRPYVSALAIARGRVLAIGDLDALAAHRNEDTLMIDLKGRTFVPGLNDSHLHIVRGGLVYNLELRWDGVPSLAEALRMLREQAARTPAPQWVRVVGGWSEFQFRERRVPTLEEINTASPDTPVFVLHLYTHALLNRAALRALGYTRETPDPPGGVIERDDRGEPTGLLIATPSAAVLYGALAGAPSLSPEAKLNSTRQFMRELNRLGITSASDAGGGGQHYPDDYEAISELAARGESTVRIAYSLFTNNPGGELEDYRRWETMTAFGDGDDRLKVNGVGEVIVYSAYDFENFVAPRPEISEAGLADLREVLGWLVEHRWPFRVHTTYNETIGKFLEVFETVDRETPFAGLHWFLDHCETIDEANIERVARLGGGIAIQDRMAFAGERFVERYGQEAADATPPIKTIRSAGVPVGARAAAAPGRARLVAGREVRRRIPPAAGGRPRRRPRPRVGRPCASSARTRSRGVGSPMGLRLPVLRLLRAGWGSAHRVRRPDASRALRSPIVSPPGSTRRPGRRRSAARHEELTLGSARAPARTMASPDDVGVTSARAGPLTGGDRRLCNPSTHAVPDFARPATSAGGGRPNHGSRDALAVPSKDSP
jgi:predicted amidohydrolase YtcJ